MKTMLSSRKHRYLAKFSIFFITVALLAGMVGCNQPTGYDLTISSTAGGNVTATYNEEEIVISPGEEKTKSDISEGTVVHLTAKAKEGYRFVEWTGDMDTIADVDATTTTITMSGRYSTISITAEFVEGREIRDWSDLDTIRHSLHGSHILMNDLDSNTPGWTDLASPTANNRSGWEPIETFAGTFDGQGHEVRDLFIDRSNKIGVGLFGYVGKDGVVKNVTVVNANVTGKGRVGGLVGSNQGTLSRSNSTGNVKGNDKVGGLVGWNGHKVENSHFSGNVTGSDEYVGGLVGWNQGTLSRSNSTGNVTGSKKYVGGLVGWNQATLTNSCSAGSVNGSDEYVGGLVGWNQGSVSSSNSTDNVTGSKKYVGGLVGWNQGTVKNSHSSGNVTGSDEHVGGLVGWNEGMEENGGTVEDSHSSSNVTGGSKHVGGLVGYNYQGTVSSSNSTGSVTGGSRVGGLLGWNEGTVKNSYSSSGVTGTDGRVGGLVGWNTGTVEESYSTGTITGEDEVGGLVGWNDNNGEVEKSYSSSNVTGTGDDVGGLVGYIMWGTVSNSYSTGSVSGHWYVGGLVGYNEQGTVENSYSTGEVTGLRYDGGLVAENNKGDVRNCFWDTETSGQATSDGGTGKTTTEMKQIKTYTETEPGVLDEKWDIDEVFPGEPPNLDRIWNIVDGNTYPCLSSLSCQSIWNVIIGAGLVPAPQARVNLANTKPDQSGNYRNLGYAKLATTACPKEMPPSLQGTCLWVRTRKPLPSSNVTAFRNSRRF